MTPPTGGEASDPEDLAPRGWRGSFARRGKTPPAAPTGEGSEAPTAQEQPAGWNAAVLPTLSYANVRILNSTALRITIGQAANYYIDEPETLSLSLPAAERAAVVKGLVKESTGFAADELAHKAPISLGEELLVLTNDGSGLQDFELLNEARRHNAATRPRAHAPTCPRAHAATRRHEPRRHEPRRHAATRVIRECDSRVWLGV